MTKTHGRSAAGGTGWVSRINTQVTLIIAIVVMCAIFTILSPVFLSLKNFINIGSYTSIMGVMATGLTLAMFLGGLDISQYSVAAFSGLFTAVLLQHEIPVGIVIPAVVAIGFAMGAVNSFIITKMKVNPIITTLGTSLIFRGAAFIMTKGRYLPIDHRVVNFIGRGRILMIPNVIWIMLITYAVFFYVLKYTVFGRNIYSVGGNASASYLSGINVNRVRFFAFAISGMMGAVAGFIMSAQMGAGLPTAGQGSELDVIVAVILGGVSLTGGKGKILGTLLGVLILGILANGMTLLSVQAYYQMLIRGLVLVVAVYLDTLRGGGYE